MSRKLCPDCRRPLKTCWCHCCRSLANRIEIGILQHPSEQKQVKSTVPLLCACLQNRHLWIGESVTDAQPLASTMPSLAQWLSAPLPTYLLYPETGSGMSVNVNVAQPQALPRLFQVLVLDGTWRKTYKLLQLNPQLAALPRISIQPQQPSNYRIRKPKDATSLSTVEAVGQLLAQFEDAPQFAATLDQAFECFQQTVFTYPKEL